LETVGSNTASGQYSAATFLGSSVANARFQERKRPSIESAVAIVHGSAGRASAASASVTGAMSNAVSAALPKML